MIFRKMLLLGCVLTTLTWAADSTNEMWGANPSRTGVYTTAALTSLTGLNWGYALADEATGPVAGTSTQVLVADTTGILTALDRTTGGVDWTRDFGAGFYSSPAVIEALSTAFVGSSTALHGVNLADGTDFWTYPTTTLAMCAPVVVNDVVYFIDASGTLHAVNAITGAGVWTYANSNASPLLGPAVAGGAVFTISSSGEVLSIDATAGTLNWQIHLTAPTNGMCAGTDGNLYITCALNGVTALSQATGATVWHRPMQVAIPTPPTLVGNTLIFGSYRTLHAIDVTTSLDVWTIDLSAQIAAPPSVAGTTVYIAKADGVIEARNSTDGVVVWQYSGSGIARQAPYVSNANVFAITGTNVYNLN